MGLVGAEAKKHVRPGLDFKDLFGEGVFGLIEAADTFDMRKANLANDKDAFPAYAIVVIRRTIRKAVRNKWSTIRLSQHAQEVVGKWHAVRVKLEERQGHSITFREVCDEMGLSRTKRKTIWQGLLAIRINRYPQGGD